MTKRTVDLDVMCGLYHQPLDGRWTDSVVAYHITPATNVSSILEAGLAAKPCTATHRGESRVAAVYLFSHRGDAYDTQIREFLFGRTDNLAVIKVTIPRSAYEALRYDGLFNMSCVCTDGSYPSGIQYAGDIPANWIEA